MKLGRKLSLLVVIFSMMSAVAAQAQEPVEPTFLRQDVWFKSTSTPVTNVDANSGTLPTWDTTKPTESVPLGAGAVYASNHYSWLNGPEHNPVNGFTVQGKFTGDIDNMAVTLYGHVPFYLVSAGCGGGIALSFDLRIDGQSILYQAQADPSAYLRTELLQPGFVSVKFRFTNIHRAMKDNAIPMGPGVTHDVYLNAINFYVCNEIAWVYDSAQAPAGAVFNLTGHETGFYTEVDVFNPPPQYGSSPLG